MTNTNYLNIKVFKKCFVFSSFHLLPSLLRRIFAINDGDQTRGSFNDKLPLRSNCGAVRKGISFLMVQTRPLFGLFLFFSQDKYSTNLTINFKSADGVLGTWTRGSGMVGPYESTDQGLLHPIKKRYHKKSQLVWVVVTISAIVDFAHENVKEFNMALGSNLKSAFQSSKFFGKKCQNKKIWKVLSS